MEVPDLGTKTKQVRREIPFRFRENHFSSCRRSDPLKHSNKYVGDTL